MLSFLTMLFTFRLGFAAMPVDEPVRSLHEASVAVALDGATAADAAAKARSPGAAAPGGLGGWQGLLSAVVPGERCARAAVWLAEHPPHVHVSSTKFYVSVHVPTP